MYCASIHAWQPICNTNVTQHCLLNAFISFLDNVIKALPYPHDEHIVMGARRRVEHLPPAGKVLNTSPGEVLNILNTSPGEVLMFNSLTPV